MVWDGVAAGWEKYRDLFEASEGSVADRMLEALGAREGDTVLELAAGPGSVGLSLAARRPDVQVLITDFAPHMVEAAARGAEERALTNVECRQMDAQAIELPDASVDGVLSRYGLMIPPDRRKAFSEIRRVLKPGRVLSYAVWGPIEQNARMIVMESVLTERGHLAPLTGGMPLSTEHANRDVLDEAGFNEVITEIIDTPMTYAGFDQYWEVNSSVRGRVAGIIASLPADERELVRAIVQKRAEPFQTPAGLVFPANRIVVRAS